jgi:predicted DNA-binding WGR domain protein
MDVLQYALFAAYGECHDSAVNSHKYWAVVAYADRLIVWHGRLKAIDATDIRNRAQKHWKQPLHGAKQEIPRARWGCRHVMDEAERRCRQKVSSGYVLIRDFVREGPATSSRPVEAKPLTQECLPEDNTTDRPERILVWW